MPGIGDEIEGAMQQAPQPGRQPAIVSAVGAFSPGLGKLVMTFMAAPEVCKAHKSSDVANA